MLLAHRGAILEFGRKNEGTLTRLFLLLILLTKGAVGVQLWAEAVGAEDAPRSLPARTGLWVLCRPAQQQLEHEDASGLALSESARRCLSTPLHNANVKGQWKWHGASLRAVGSVPSAADARPRKELRSGPHQVALR